MPDSKSNQEERIARLEALMEEYRVKAEVTRATVERVHRDSREAVKAAKAALDRVRQRKASNPARRA